MILVHQMTNWVYSRVPYTTHIHLDTVSVEAVGSGCRELVLEELCVIFKPRESVEFQVADPVVASQLHVLPHPHRLWHHQFRDFHIFRPKNIYIYIFQCYNLFYLIYFFQKYFN